MANDEFLQALKDQLLNLNIQRQRIDKQINALQDYINTLQQENTPPNAKISAERALKRKEDSKPIKVNKVSGTDKNTRKVADGKADWSIVGELVVKYLEKNGESKSDQIAKHIRSQFPNLTENNIKTSGLFSLVKKKIIKKIGHGVFGPLNVKSEKPVPYKDRKEVKPANEQKGDFFDPKKDHAFAF
jgi:hypothetical protein